MLNTDISLKIYINSLIDIMGANNPKKVFEDPLASKKAVYKPSLRTKSYLTKTGFLKIGDSIETLAPLRQCPSMNITINNNLERTPALFEDDSIENSLGNFDVSGTLDVYNVDDIGHELYNDAVDGKDKVIQIQLSRAVNGVTTSYTLTLNVHLSAPTESRNGNKLQFSVGFTLNDDEDLSLVKEVQGLDASAEKPVISASLADVSCNVGDDISLDATATVGDSGKLSYSWTKDGEEVGNSAIYKPSTAAAGTSEYKVVVTNTLGKSTAKSEKTVQVVVSEA